MTLLLMSSPPISISHQLLRCRYSNSRDIVASSPSFSLPATRGASESLHVGWCSLYYQHFCQFWVFIAKQFKQNGLTGFKRHFFCKLPGSEKWVKIGGTLSTHTLCVKSRGVIVHGKRWFKVFQVCGCSLIY